MKTIILFAILSSVVCLSCTNKRQQAQPEATPDKELTIIGSSDTVTNIKVSSTSTLKEHGLQLTQQMRQLANDQEYLNFCSHSRDVNKIVADIAQYQYDSPEKVFSVRHLIADSSNPFINDRKVRSIPFQLNALSGATTLAAASLFVADDAFFYGMNLKAPTIYLYLYDGDWQSMVIFRPVREGIVQANSYFVHHGMLNDIKDTDDVKSFFSEVLEIDSINVQECK